LTFSSFKAIIILKKEIKPLSRQKGCENMKSIIKPFEIPKAAAPWVGVDILEKGKTAGVKPAATTKASK
jgi:hypothetical protein